MMRLKHAKSSEGKVIRLITYAIAILIALSLPSVYFSSRYQFALGEVETNANLSAGFITQRINANPELWKFEEHRLVNLVETDVLKGSNEAVYSVLDQDRQVIVQSSEMSPPPPVIVHEAVLYDSGNVVGYYKVMRSIRNLVKETLWIALAGIAFGLAIAFSVNVLPLRALLRAEERLMFMARHDSLTGLPNRVMLKERLGRALLFAERYKLKVTVVFIDLDNFKLINDSLGHSLGDELLKALAERLVECLRYTDTVARLGGDEFVIVLPNMPDDRELLTDILERLRQAINKPVMVSGRMLQMTCSMGLATYPGDGVNAEALLMNADAAMFRAKELGRNTYQYYTAELNRMNQEKLLLQDGLRNAIARNEFFLVYQPKADIKSGAIIGIEALIRWQHPEWGLIMPADFIPAAEQSGMIMPIGDWVLETACAQNKAWQDAGFCPLLMAVNVSARQFSEKDIVAKVERALEKSGLQANWLELELTESLIMKDPKQSVDKMRELQSMGVHLAIDDFGTGYSSLSALKRFPINRLKIDRSFVRGLPEDDDDKTIVAAMISMAHKLNLRVIAEGVETQHQLVFLERHACDEIQGYLFSKPVSATEIEELMLRPETQSSEQINMPSLFA